MDLYVDVFNLTKAYPDSERFGLIAQLRSSADSVPSNIAEGVGRGTRGSKLYFLDVARGSMYELHTRLEMARRVGYPAPPSIFVMHRQVLGLLHGYIVYVRDKKD